MQWKGIDNMEHPVFNKILYKLRDTKGVEVWEHNISYNNDKFTITFKVNGEWFEYEMLRFEKYYKEHPELEYGFVESYVYYILHQVRIKEKMKSYHPCGNYLLPEFDTRNTMTIYYTDLFEDDELKEEGVEFEYTREFTFADYCDYMYIVCAWDEERLPLHSLEIMWDEGIIDLIEIETNSDFQEVMRDKYREDAENEYKEFYKL